MCSTDFERTGDEAHITAITGLVNVFGWHVRARDVVERAVGEVLQAAGHARRVVLFHHRQVDDLGHFRRDDLAEIRTRLAFAEAIHLAEDLAIVAAVRLAVGGPFLIEADHAHAGRHQRVIPVHFQLIRVAVVDDDPRVRHADRVQRADHFAQQRDLRGGLRRARRIDLDADDVGLVEEAGPGVLRARVAGEGEHAARDHLAHRFRRDAAIDDGALVERFDDASGKQAGHAERRARDVWRLDVDLQRGEAGIGSAVRLRRDHPRPERIAEWSGGEAGKRPEGRFEHKRATIHQTSVPTSA